MAHKAKHVERDDAVTVLISSTAINLWENTTQEYLMKDSKLVDKIQHI